MMVKPIQLETDRLLLRPWRDADKAPFATMNADPRVMEHFPALQSRAESDASVARVRAQFAAHGWGFWATEEKASGRFIGFIGVQQLRDTLPIAPGVEIGWRLHPDFWGQGLAPEGAQASLDFAFQTLGVDEVVAYAPRGNVKSHRVMVKIGMTEDPSRAFIHPELPDGPWRDCVVYAIRRPA